MRIPIGKLVVACGLPLVMQGCAYKMQISSTPAPVSVELPDGTRAVTPQVVSMRWVPFGRQVIRASALGYRPMEVDLRDREIRWSRYVTDTLFHPATLFGASRGEVRLVMVPVHGPAGTWTEDDVP